jgi:hypothetical protein
MNFKRRLLYIGLSLCMFAVTGIPGWTSPFSAVGTGAFFAQAQDQPKQEQPKSATFTGNIVKDGEQFVLQETSGNVYTLDDQERAKSFEGKAVKVTGTLDTEAKLIHVESIESSEA